MHNAVASFCIPVPLEAPGYREVLIKTPLDRIVDVDWLVLNSRFTVHQQPYSLVRYIHGVGPYLLIGVEPLAYWRRTYINVVATDADGTKALIPICIASIHDILEMGEGECLKDDSRARLPKERGYRRRLRLK